MKAKQLNRRDFIAMNLTLVAGSICAGAAVADNNDELNLNAMMGKVESTSVLKDENWFIWGGGMVRTADGKCHMLFARWPKEKGFNSWVTDSEVAHAIADHPGGPYRVTGTVLPRRKGFWDGENTHNPLIKEFDGKYYLYYTGNYGNGEWWDHRNHQRVGVAVADHPAGPYQRFDQPLLDVSPGSFDALLTSSPTVARNNRGKYFMVYKGVSEGEMPFGGKVKMGLATATHPAGPWKKEKVTLFGHPTEPFPTDDNYIWFQDNRFYAIVKDYRGFYTKQANPGLKENESLVLFTSIDGKDWKLAKHPFVSDFHIKWADGTTSERLHRLDQPQIWLENGKPAVLFLAVKAKDDADNSDLSYNIQVPLVM